MICAIYGWTPKCFCCIGIDADYRKQGSVQNRPRTGCFRQLEQRWILNVIHVMGHLLMQMKDFFSFWCRTCKICISYYMILHHYVLYIPGCTVWYYIILYYIILYYIVLYYSILCYIISYYSKLHYIILYHIILSYSILFYSILFYYIILYYIILYYIILYHIILYCTILYYIILYYVVDFNKSSVCFRFL